MRVYYGRDMSFRICLANRIPAGMRTGVMVLTPVRPVKELMLIQGNATHQIVAARFAELMVTEVLAAPVLMAKIVMRPGNARTTPAPGLLPAVLIPTVRPMMSAVNAVMEQSVVIIPVPGRPTCVNGLCVNGCSGSTPCGTPPNCTAMGCDGKCDGSVVSCGVCGGCPSGQNCIGCDDTTVGRKHAFTGFAPLILPDLIFSCFDAGSPRRPFRASAKSFLWRKKAGGPRRRRAANRPQTECLRGAPPAAFPRPRAALCRRPAAGSRATTPRRCAVARARAPICLCGAAAAARASRPILTAGSRRAPPRHARRADPCSVTLAPSRGRSANTEVYADRSRSGLRCSATAATGARGTSLRA